MTNTVLLKGKGESVRLTFIILSDVHKSGRITQGKRRFWDMTTRYELRLQNLTAQEIENIREMINVFRPISTRISLEVF